MRVLHLNPATLSKTPLVFPLIVQEIPKDIDSTSLDDYLAISYTWDASRLAKSPHAIRNDSSFYRTAKISLHICVYARRSVQLWIEQVCIDQTSTEGKTLNVRQMGAIYRAARSVVIWTGSCDQELWYCLQIDTTISYNQPPYFFILFDDFALPNPPWTFTDLSPNSLAFFCVSLCSLRVVLGIGMPWTLLKWLARSLGGISCW